MKATVLVDNIAGGDLSGEWGLSIYIENQGKKILLDTGASGLFLKNAEALGLSIRAVDAGVLSHAHYDHADGMADFFKENDQASFYLREGAGENCYEKKGAEYQYIGLPRHILSDYKERIVFVSGDYTLFPGVYLIPHKTPGLSEMGEKNNMVVYGDKGWQPDDFSHEQSLVIQTGQGLVIFNSCSHGGADTIIREVKATFPDQKINALIGGFHLYARSGEEVRDLAWRIRETGIQTVITGHCTGDKGYKILKEELGDRVTPMQVGRVMAF